MFLLDNKLKGYFISVILVGFAGADPGFQDRGGGGGVLKKIGPSGGRRENIWVFRVKNHDFTPKNHIFSNFRGGGVRAGCAPPPGSAPGFVLLDL